MGTIVVEREPDEMDLAFYSTLDGCSPAWAMRAIAGYTTRRVTDTFGADGRGPSLEQLNHNGLSHAHSDEERAAWTHGFTYPDTRVDRPPPVVQPKEPGLFTCERCRITYRTISEEQARAERGALWGGPRQPDDAVLCDPCFKVVLEWARTEGLVQR